MAFLYTPSYATVLYTTDADYAIHYTCAYIQVYRTHAIMSVVYGRNAGNEPVSRIKMADYSELVSMGTLLLSSKRSHYTKNAKLIRY